MRLFLLILLVCFHHGSFAGGDKSEVTSIHYSGDFEKTSLLQTESSASLAKFSAHLTQFRHVKNISPQRQQRQQMAARFVGGSVLIKNIVIETASRCIIADYNYCKPIRLILLFPQHYFW